MYLVIPKPQLSTKGLKSVVAVVTAAWITVGLLTMAHDWRAIPFVFLGFLALGCWVGLFEYLRTQADRVDERASRRALVEAIGRKLEPEPFQNLDDEEFNAIVQHLEEEGM